MNSWSEPKGPMASFVGFFIRSKLTILIIILSLVAGVIGVLVTPREEDPSINVTMADVIIGYPGQGAKIVDERLGRTVSAWVKEIPGVEHVMSSSADDGAFFIVQFRSGIKREEALTSLYDRLNANADQLPPGTLTPIVKPRGIDDVPVLAVTLWSERDDPAVLRQVASELSAELRSIGNISRVEIIGGSSRVIRVDLDARRMADLAVGADRVLQVIQASNLLLPSGMLAGQGGSFRVEAGAFIRNAADVESLIVGSNPAGLVYMRDVARVSEGMDDPSNYVSHIGRDTSGATHAAVTLIAAKVRETNGSVVTAEARNVLDRCAEKFLSSDIHMSIVRDSGLTASRRVNTMLEHMGLATLIVVVLILLALGWREAVIMAVLIPVMLAVCPFVYYLTGYTLNRITLAAMIFAIGFLVDNAIVVMENIHRHFQMHKGDYAKIAAGAVKEIGSPTILATLMIIGALLPTACVTGTTGQYSRPIPIGASIAVLYSLFIAFTVAPFLSYIFLRHSSEHSQAGDGSEKKITVRYRAILTGLMNSRKRMRGVYLILILSFVVILVLILTRVSVFRLFPMNDSDEMSVMIDMPPQTTLEENFAIVTDIASRLTAVSEITGCQSYVGTHGPLTFQGMARHYMLREGVHQSEIQIQLTPSEKRWTDSHEVAGRVREIVTKALENKNAVFTVAELPPGPPVQAALVAEIYGPDDEGRLALADEVMKVFRTTRDVVEVDWTARAGAPILRYNIDLQKAASRGVMAAQAATTMRTFMTGDKRNWAHRPEDREPVGVAVRLAASERADETDIESIRFTSLIPGASVPALDIGSIERKPGSFPIMRKDMDRLVMVTAEVVGDGPLYSIIDLTKKLKDLRTPDNKLVKFLWNNSSKPPLDRYALRWGGEWTLTYDNLIRDLGLAFLVVLFLIYLTMVAWYDSSSTPLVIMLPIPLIMLGVIPGHLLFGELVTGLSVIGVIALAGIMVRNSILLVDFSRTLIHSGMPIKEAILSASQTRLRPILLTSATVILGDGVLFFDPLLKGMGVTMSVGALVSTALTLIVVPMAYYQLAERRKRMNRDV